jgi:decaprenylphospho-beta-D-ribofuranose 2-oxidase
MSGNVVTTNIRETLELLDQDDGNDFHVAWVDAFARGSTIGRGYVTRARWLGEGPSIDANRLAASLSSSSKVFGLLPPGPTWLLARPAFGPAGIRCLNALHYAQARARASGQSQQLFTEYNFVHNRIPRLNDVYRPQGFLELQPLIPRAAGHDAVVDLLRLCQELGAQSLLCGVKRQSPDDFLLSYQGDGYSIGIDIQLRGRKPQDVATATRRIFEFTVQRGGLVYLAKDGSLPRDLFERMFPGAAEFRAIKRRLDPGGLFASDMARRLGLC